MSYSPNLKLMSIDAYQEYLLGKTLLPGRVGLRDNIQGYFNAIHQAGISDVESLSKSLSTPQKLTGFSRQTSIPEQYLVLLKREIGSLMPKPLPIKELSAVDENTGKMLDEAGIKTTKDFYEACKAGALDFLQKQIAQDLFSLCDLTRINGMGLLAARLWKSAGYDSCESIAAAEAETMLARVLAANTGEDYYTGTLGLKDMQFCIDNAKFLRKYAASQTALDLCSASG